MGRCRKLQADPYATHEVTRDVPGGVNVHLVLCGPCLTLRVGQVLVEVLTEPPFEARAGGVGDFVDHLVRQLWSISEAPRRKEEQTGLALDILREG